MHFELVVKSYNKAVKRLRVICILFQLYYFEGRQNAQCRCYRVEVVSGARESVQRKRSNGRTIGDIESGGK